MLQGMDMNRFWKKLLGRKFAVALAAICLEAPPVFAAPDGAPVFQPVPASARPTNALPSKITTTDGVTYEAPRLTRVEPDGLLVEFSPASGGTGLAKLKFAKLPASLQKQFGYDPGKATNYEHQETLATQSFVQKLRQDDVARSASLTLQNELALRPNLTGAISVNSAEPVITYSYYAPNQKPFQLGRSAANLEHHYQCQAKFGVQVEPGAAGTPVHFHIDRVLIALGLTCRLTEPTNSDDIIRQHEEGHRKVCEYFYRLGPQVAQAIGVSVVGREFTAAEVDFESEKKRALAEAEMEIISQYILRIEAAVRKADLEYGRLTDNGANNVDRTQAAQDACDKFAKDFLNPATPIKPR